MGDLILTEVLQGLQSDVDYRTARDLLLRLPFAAMGARELALESAANYRTPRKKGVTVRKTIDVMIGTFCIHHHLPLLHEDGGLSVFS
jgi:predicted nucleic acid-binding protein